MIKKIKTLIYTLIITGIFLITGINTTNGAGAYTTVGLDKYNSAINSQFKLGFLQGGGFLTEYLGQGKSILAMDNNVLFRRAPNGQPYFYSPNMQGFFSHYAVCDYMANTNSGLKNCSMSLLTGDFKAMLKGFFSKVKQGDIAYYNYQYDQGGVSCGYHHYYITVCWSSEEIGNTLCFNYQNCYNGCSLNQCPQYCSNGLCGGGLINSQNLHDIDRGLVANSRIGKAPGQLGYNDSYQGNGNQGSLEIDQGTIYLTGDYTYLTCTYGELIQEFNNQGWSKYYCYGGLDNFDLYNSNSSYSPIPGSGKTLNQILAYSNSWDTPQEWFDFWNGLYKDKNNSMYNSMWESYPAVFRTWFDIFYQYGGGWQNFDDVREYCNIVLNLDSLSGSVYNGSKFKGVCKTIIDEKNDNIFGSGGAVVGGLNWGSNVKPQTNAVEFIQNFFNKLNVVIPTDYQDLGLGVLPIYIITFLIALIFFRFLSH